MMTKNNPKEALGYYLPVLEELPGDVVLEKKVADAYRAMKDWSRAYMHFTRSLFAEMTQEEQVAFLGMLFLMEDAPNRTEELQKFPLSEADRAYFLVINICFQGSDDCIEALRSYDGEEARIVALKDVIQSASKVSDDRLYMLFLLSAKLYEQKMYRLAGMFSNEILTFNPNYQQVKKLRGFALFEL